MKRSIGVRDTDIGKTCYNNGVKGRVIEIIDNVWFLMQNDDFSKTVHPVNRSQAVVLR